MATVMSDIWQDLVCVKRWTPIKEVKHPTQEVLPGIYLFSRNSYIITQNINKNFESDPHLKPYCLALLWASSYKGLEKFINDDAEIKLDKTEEKMPHFFIKSHLQNYITFKSFWKAIESAQYTSKGFFLHKLLMGGNFSCYFLERNDVINEVPYCIVFSLDE